MREISVNKGRIENYSIARCYDNKEEFIAKEGGKYSDNLIDCQVGDYYHTSNGWFLPVMHRKQFKNKAAYAFRVANRSTVVFYNKKQNVWKHTPIIFNPDDRNCRNLIHRVKLKTVAQLILAGMPVLLALEKVYQWRCGQGSKMFLRAYLDVVEHPEFLEALKGQIMDINMEDAMNNNGINEDWFVKIMKEIAEDKKESNNMRMMALTFLGRTIGSGTQIVQPEYKVRNGMPYNPNQLKEKFNS